MTWSDQPFFLVQPQRCFVGSDSDKGASTELELGGTGTFEGDAGLIVVLSGSFVSGPTRGSATLQLTEGW